MSGFQTQVNANQAPGVEGDFCSANPRYSALAGPNGLVAGRSRDAAGNILAGALVGRFAWLSDEHLDGDNAPAVVNNFGSGPVAGLIHREQQGLITVYLQEASMLVPTGFPITVLDSVEMWVVNRGATDATVGMKAYANYADGSASFAAAGSPGTASGSASSIAAATNGFAGNIVGNLLTVETLNSGTIYPGTTISGIGVATGTKITAQLSGTPGGVGTYSVSIPDQSVDPGTVISGTYGTLTVGGTVAGVFGVGDTISGTNVVTGTTITARISGTGGAGTYAVDNNTVVGSTAITAGTSIETNWICRSFGNPGELVKISQVRTFS